MSYTEIATTILSVGNVAIMYLLSRFRLAGWYANAGWQFAWLPYDIWSRQYGFIMLFVAYLAISVRAIVKLRHEVKPSAHCLRQDAAPDADQRAPHLVSPMRPMIRVY